MSDNPKAAWPKTPDGTIDWEVVFEDPNTGLIPLVERVRSSEALHSSGEVIFSKLFTRKNDAEARAQMIFRLDEVIAAGGSVEDMTAQVVGLMREVKDERIEKARVYVERKRAGASIDRRAGLFWKIDKLLNPWVLLPVGGLLVLALAGLVYFGLHSTMGPDTPSPDLAQTETEQAPSEPEAEPAPDPNVVQPGQPFPIWLKTIRWPIDPMAKARPQYYAVIPYVTDLDHKIDFCRLLPKMMDRIHTVLERNLPKERMARADELALLRDEFKAGFNALLGEDLVIDVVFARYGTAEFKVSTQPPFCKSPKMDPDAARERLGR